MIQNSGSECGLCGQMTLHHWLVGYPWHDAHSAILPLTVDSYFLIISEDRSLHVKDVLNRTAHSKYHVSP